MTDDEFEIFLRRANVELRKKQAQLKTRFGIGSYARWWFDQDNATLQFFAADDRLGLEAEIVPIGTFKQETWKWAWANDSFVSPLRHRGEVLKGLEGITGMSVFSRADLLPADEGMAWELAAISVMHLDALGCYRAPSSGGLNTFLAITSVRVSSESPI